MFVVTLRRSHVVVLALACTIITPILESRAATHGDCECPENGEGWVAFPDTIIAPDFLSKSSVEIQRVVLCDRAAHLLFGTRQGGKRCDAWLTIEEPTLDQLLQDLPPDSMPGDDDFARIVSRLELERSIFDECVKNLRDLFQFPAGGNQSASFEAGWFRRSPRLLPTKPLTVEWKDVKVEVVGLVDVFFRH